MPVSPSAIKRRFPVSLWTGLVMIGSPTGQAPAWPMIRPAHTEYVYVNPGKAGTDTQFQFFIDDSAGQHAYWFECHHDYYAEDYEIRFSGDFQCMLFPYIKDTVSALNLLATDKPAEQGNDWHNRGRVLAAQFQGECLHYPEYSTVRHFHLRNMVLTLSFSDIKWQASAPAKLAGFKMTLDAVPDNSAKDLFAAPAEGPGPPSKCYPGPSA